MFLTLTALFLRIFSNPVANMFEKKVSTSGSSLNTCFYSYMLMAICCIPFAFKYNWTSLPLTFWIYVLSAGLMCAAARACMVKALQLGELSVLGPINSYKSVVGLVIGIILLKEYPDIYGLFGMLLVICGSWFIFDTLDEGFSFKVLMRKDIALRFIALFLTGFEAVLLKKIILISNVEISYILWAFTGFMFTFLIVKGTNTKIEPLKKETFYQYLIIAISLAIMQISTNYVFLNMKVAYALALFQLSSVVNLFFGVKFFTERNLLKKLTGSIIMLLGSIIIIL